MVFEKTYTPDPIFCQNIDSACPGNAEKRKRKTNQRLTFVTINIA